MKFDDRVTYAVLLALAIETVGGLLWAGGAAARLTAAEAHITAQSDVAERLARLEASLADARASLTRIEERLDHKERR